MEVDADLPGRLPQPKTLEDYIQRSAELPTLMSKYDYYCLQSNFYEGERSFVSSEFGTGLPVPTMRRMDNFNRQLIKAAPSEHTSVNVTDWRMDNFNRQLIKAAPSEYTLVNITDLKMSDNSNVTNIERHERMNKWEGHYLRSQSDTWSEIEEASFILALYIFGKEPEKVKNFFGNKGMGDILAFYYGKFYMSDRYWRWYECSKNVKCKQCIFGSAIFRGTRQDEFLSRVRPNVSEECYSELLKVSNTFAADQMTLKCYVSTLKDLVGLKVLVETVGIGTEKDLTGFHAIPNGRKIPAVKDCPRLAVAEIIQGPRGDFRLIKARRHLFWKDVWPGLVGLVDRCGRFKQHPSNNYAVGSRKSSPLLIRKMEGNHYFDSMVDILKIVTSNTELAQRHHGPKLPTPNFNPEKRRLTEDGVMKACAFEDGSVNKNTSSKRKKSDFADVMCLDKGKTSDTNGASSSIVRENNPSEKVLPKKQKRGRRDAKPKSEQNIIADGKNIVAVPPAPEKQKRFSGQNASLSMALREKPIENVTAESLVAPKVNQMKRSNNLLNPNLGENTVSKGTQPKTVAQSQSTTNSIIKEEVLPRSMIDLNLPALIDDDDDPPVAAISKAVNATEKNTPRRSTRTPIPSKLMLAYWESKDL